jgi:hypothetical protein
MLPIRWRAKATTTYVSWVRSGAPEGHPEAQEAAGEALEVLIQQIARNN